MSKCDDGQVALQPGAPLAGLFGSTLQVGDHRVELPSDGGQVRVPKAVAERLLSQAGWHRAAVDVKLRRGREERT